MIGTVTRFVGVVYGHANYDPASILGLEGKYEKGAVNTAVFYAATAAIKPLLGTAWNEMGHLSYRGVSAQIAAAAVVGAGAGAGVGFVGAEILEQSGIITPEQAGHAQDFYSSVVYTLTDPLPDYMFGPQGEPLPDEGWQAVLDFPENFYLEYIKGDASWDWSKIGL